MLLNSKAQDAIYSEKKSFGKIVPKGGANLFSLIIGSQELFGCASRFEKASKRCTRNPILYPTPNRIKNAVYVFMADTLKMSFPAKQGHTSATASHGTITCGVTALRLPPQTLFLFTLITNSMKKSPVSRRIRSKTI